MSTLYVTKTVLVVDYTSTVVLKVNNSQYEKGERTCEQ
jgi:hypothetical protein